MSWDWSHRYTMDKKTGVCLRVHNSLTDKTPKQFRAWLEKNTDTTGMYKIGDQWHSESLDAPIAHVGREIAEAFGMVGLPNVVIEEVA